MKEKQRQRALYMTDKDHEEAKREAKLLNMSFSEYMNQLHDNYKLNRETQIVKK